METIKEPVRLRQRKMPTGNISLYLDIYIEGKRTYEYLKLYLIPEKTREDKEKNRQTMALANAVKAKRIVEIQNQEFGFKSQYKTDSLFMDYYNRLCQSRLGVESRSNWGAWLSCKKHMERYDKHLDKRRWDEITPQWVQGFKDYLDNEAYAWSEEHLKRKPYPLSRNTKYNYYNKLKCCLKEAYEQRVIPTDPSRGIERFKPEEGTRMYLTIDEIKKLAQTPCDYESVKKAFLFSCLTGIRRCDIMKMTWSEVHEQDGFTRIIFRQKKTGGQEYLDINAEAAALMGERRKPEDQVFANFYTATCTNYAIRNWCLRAGITKEITFHSARHTFATMMLTIGTDIYTVSKLLGHTDVHVTQIYAKVIDQQKQNAISAIPALLTLKDDKQDDKGDNSPK